MDESQPMQKVHIAFYTILSDWVAKKIIFFIYILGGILCKIHNFRILKGSKFYYDLKISDDDQTHNIIISINWFGA